MEIWKSISKYENIYEVSNKGRIRSLNRYIKYSWKKTIKIDFIYGRVLKPKKDKDGYLEVNLYLERKIAKMHKIHRIVAKEFIPNPKNKPQINHKNGIKSDNKIENLEWVTGKENVQHAIRKKLYTSNMKKINQFSIENKFIKTFNSINEAKRKTGCSCVSDACRGNLKTSGGYIWKYAK
jgi:hypothetical protein